MADAGTRSGVESLTGGDPITARYMSQDFFTYRPQFKLLIAGNHRPGLRNVDEAIGRRLHLIPFFTQSSCTNAIWNCRSDCSGNGVASSIGRSKAVSSGRRKALRRRRACVRRPIVTSKTKTRSEPG